MKFDFSELKLNTLNELDSIRAANGDNIPRMGALCNAALKRFRGKCIVQVIEIIVIENDLDISFTSANIIAKDLLGRGMNAKLLMEGFATHSRTAASKVPHQDVLQAREIAMMYKESILENIENDIVELKAGNKRL